MPLGHGKVGRLSYYQSIPLWLVNIDSILLRSPSRAALYMFYFVYTFCLSTSNKLQPGLSSGGYTEKHINKSFRRVYIFWRDRAQINTQFARKYIHRRDKSQIKSIYMKLWPICLHLPIKKKKRKKEMIIKKSSNDDLGVFSSG